MATRWKISILAAVVVLVGVWQLLPAGGPQDPQRTAAHKANKDGNFKVAFEGLKKLTLDPGCDPLKVGGDLEIAINCLYQLGRVDEIDDYRESVSKVHAGNWRLLETAANSYASDQHYGAIIAGKFYRGQHRGGARYVSTMQRDRVRAYQLLEQALKQSKNDKDRDAVAQLHLRLANLVLNGGGQHEPWRLQYLTDLSKLPDYDDGYFGQRGEQYGPVDEQGNPVYYKLPKSWETAQSDGERWRWLLNQATELNAKLFSESEMVFANFLKSQFDVQTMAWGFNPLPEDSDKTTGTFAIHMLKENETIARLATGLKRFTLPDEFNFLKVYQRVADRAKDSWSESAFSELARSFENRRQYPRAAEVWTQAIKVHGPGEKNWRQQQLDQIVGNWGRFEPGAVQPAGQQPTFDFRFRNGNKVSFEASEILVEKLLDDVKAYLRASPNQLDGQTINIGDIGHRLVEQNQAQYLGKKVAAWDSDLKPRPNHVDQRITITAPLNKAGAYLVTAKMAGGNESRIIVWVADTVILKKQLVGQVFYQVADATTGEPLPQVSLELFGWRQIQIVPNQNKFKVLTTTVNHNTDADGQLILDSKSLPEQYQWLATARQVQGGKEGGNRFAYLGFSNIWFGQRYDMEYNETKVLTITDRPVYRPNQMVQFKTWIRHAKYDQADTSSFAGQDFKVEINNPQGEKVVEKTYTADEYGGLAGEYFLPRNVMLGQYVVQVSQGKMVWYGGYFRVEEYKKPEFEVTVEAPKEPVRLGDEITATIKAKYYFGAPVTKGTVKYKVTRSSYSSQWYPAGQWDWFYGTGYWWFAADYDWYPGFGDWGCRRPFPIWWRGDNTPPEVVLENEVPIGPDGTVKVAIDTKTAKELHGNQDHSYSITAEVVDESRRLINGAGQVLATRKPFQVYTWLDRGHYRAGDTVKATFNAQTLDHKPVEGKGELTLFAISYDKKNQPVEKAVETWKLDTNAEGRAEQQLKAAKPGQYRISYKVTDSKKHVIEGGYLFVVRGDGFDGKDFRFNDLELIADKREYQPGDKVKLLVNTNHAKSTVLLFVRPANGVYLPPKLLRLAGKSIEEEIAVNQKDMPNFFVEAVTISAGRIHSETREIVVPPEKRVVNVEVLPSKQEYKPGEKATVKLKLTDHEGKPFVGSTVVSIYDKAVDYISGGSNVPEIKEFFWKWRRQHRPQSESSLAQSLYNLQRRDEIGMGDLGEFGGQALEELAAVDLAKKKEEGVAWTPPREAVAGVSFSADSKKGGKADPPGGYIAHSVVYPREMAKVNLGLPLLADPVTGGEQPLVQPTIRRNFADTAFWTARLTTDKDGTAEVKLDMPENLTAWKIKVWAMGHGTRVGQGEAVVTTKKDLIVRLQAPRFFTQKDEVVLSANVHNYLKEAKKVLVTLETTGGTLGTLGAPSQNVTIPAGGEQRVDWRVKVTGEGEAVVRMKAQTDVDADAMEMRFPCYVHGMLKTESFTGVIRPDKSKAIVNLTVPAERRINQTVLEIRYSPTLAGAMVDALPYLADYPYGCTEQTLNRFLPTVITQKLLVDMKLDLKEIEKHQTNLNAAEIGKDKERVADWQRLLKRNAVWNIDEVKDMSAAGVKALQNMQLADGGWGWFSGFGERSYPHTTAIVVHGLQQSAACGFAPPPGVLERGVEWLKVYQAEQIRLLQNAPTKTRPYKEHADNMDALVYMVLVDADHKDDTMREFLYRDRVELAVYAKAMFGLSLHKQGRADELKMILQNIEQYLVQDNENQTAYLRMPEGNAWWYWHGSDIEANAYYLKLLSRTNPKDEHTSRLVKYLLNNRRHATYWNSTRDSAVVVEAFAEYLKASGEDAPDMTVEVWIDGAKRKEVKITRENLFSFDNKLILLGDAVDSGKHTIEIRRQGTGPVYFNAYLTNFTLEDFITKAGLEVRVNRKYFKLTPVDHKIKVSGSKGQALDQKVEKYERTELKNLANLKSGDLVEIELEIDSKNDYEYLCFEDPKAAGFEPMTVQSGYTNDGLGAYMELRDEKVCFFVRTLAQRGKHSISYRMRAEIPGQFSALPTRAYAMYAPELKGNSDEIKLVIQD